MTQPLYTNGKECDYNNAICDINTCPGDGIWVQNPDDIISLYSNSAVSVLDHCIGNGLEDICQYGTSTEPGAAGYYYDPMTGYNSYVFAEVNDNELTTSEFDFATAVTFQICQTGQVSGGGAGGDPHIKTWTGQKYDFMGECDLILAKSLGFGESNEGFEIQIRTEIRDSWSFISAVALKIGHDVFEVHSDGLHFFNSKEVDLLDHHHTLSEKYPITWSLKYSSKTSGKKAQQFTVNLGTKGEIIIRLFDGFVHLSITDASADDFGDSIGLMGSFANGKLVGRDGETAYDREDDLKTDAFSMEWQVGNGDDDVTLFRDVGSGPQYPAMCKMPAVKSSLEARRLATDDHEFVMKAEEACSGYHSSNADMEDCLYDVLATGNLDMAEFGAF